MGSSDTSQLDRWATWILERRFGGDREKGRPILEQLYKVRDRVLDSASLHDGETLLDVGSGDGLIAFGALERAPNSTVFASDISADLLRHSLEAAEEMGENARCHFVQMPAERLSFRAKTVDVVTTRSVLIYVQDKAAAFREFYRVLRPDGRISLFEPINSYFERDEARPTYAGFDLLPVTELAHKVLAIYRRLQPQESDPMLNFGERDLLAFAEAAGFRNLTLTLEIEVKSHEPIAWEIFSNLAGNPLIPTLNEAMEETLTATERDRFVSHLRPLVEAGEGTWRLAVAYIRALR